MDVMMPVMTGFEACAAMKENDATKDTPIILVTTRGEEENMEKGFKSGCTDYITKPINSTEFLKKVRNYLGE
jgi:CheY-like chemotaxis protein